MTWAESRSLLFLTNSFRLHMLSFFCFFRRYGDIVAVTNAGQVMTIILMLVGEFTCLFYILCCFLFLFARKFLIFSLRRCHWSVSSSHFLHPYVFYLLGQFYMAMPLTAAASTFYSVHEIYNAKRAKISDERNKAEAGKTGNKDDKGNIIAVTGICCVLFFFFNCCIWCEMFT